MSGRGKGGKGIGKGGAKRHRKYSRGNIMGVTKADIRRLARRGGVRRMSAGIYDMAREALKFVIYPPKMDRSPHIAPPFAHTVVSSLVPAREFVETVIRDAVLYTEHGGLPTTPKSTRENNHPTS